jgi:hypothetical protein
MLNNIMLNVVVPSRRGAATFSITPLSIITFSETMPHPTHNAYAKCHDVECLLLSVTIKATMLNVVILNVMAATTKYIYSS